MKRLSVWGVGPKMFISTASYAVVMFTLYFMSPDIFIIREIPYLIFLAAAALLLGIGVPFYLVSIKTINRAYRNDSLYTKGVYQVCRHPLYASMIFFNVPAILLLFQSWLLLTIPVFLYIVFRIFIKTEETYLENRFGDAYLSYKEKTGLIFPRLWRISG